MIHKKGVKIALFMYLILALIGSAAISAGEAFYLIQDKEQGEKK
jgi:hypothetical protein